ncbi:MAG TPA: hypothetical protein VGN28_05910 [Blastococcus sp.]|nr:hypothetical protein [Blastococcus sp.]
MSKLLRFPLTLLAVLGALLFLPGVASADTPSAAQCAAHPARPHCPQPPSSDTATTDGAATTPLTLPGGDSATAATPLAAVVPDHVQNAPVAPVVTPPPVPNCDALPGIGLPPCAPPACTPAGPTTTLPTDVLPPPPCVPAPPPTCVPIPGLGGLCQFPDSDCPPPAPTTTTPSAAAVTDGTCTPPITCDQFAQLFGFGDKCTDIPMCIPQDKVPPGFPIPVPSPPLCSPGAGGTPPPPSNPGTSTGTGTTTTQPPTETPPQQPPAAQPAAATTVTTTPQPTGKLAYTGLELGPQLNVAWTLLVLGTGLLILGRRRA